MWFRPPSRMPVTIRGTAAPARSGTTLRILSWNVQFCAGRGACFFYDGGTDSRVSEDEVEHTLEGVIDLIRRHDPDVVLLQEVDRRSARTAWIDQHHRIRVGLGLRVSASTPYFKVPYVPVPSHAPMGAVDMHLSVFSRVGLSNGVRHRLPPLDEPRWRRAFNLRRAILALDLHTLSGPIQLLNTHLSAFSRGDGTLARQMDLVLEVLQADRALLAGDFNSLPPDDLPARLGAAAVLYERDASPVIPLYETATLLSDDRTGTYVPWGTFTPDRTIDYVFGRGLEATNSFVDPAGALFSDHLPLVVDIRVDPEAP